MAGVVYHPLGVYDPLGVHHSLNLCIAASNVIYDISGVHQYQ